MNDLIYSEMGFTTSTIALIDSNTIASWVYISVATISVLLGIFTLGYNYIKAWKNDHKIDDEEKEALMKQVEELKKQLDEINNNKPNN